eukprot:scaffold80086_cov40-Phaeocystis_antarctica.AAC.2
MARALWRGGGSFEEGRWHAVYRGGEHAGTRNYGNAWLAGLQAAHRLKPCTERGGAGHAR